MRGKRNRSESPSSEEGSMRDNEKARGIKDALCNLLDGIEGGGSFATSGAFAGAPLPDLSLKGYGPIPLPLAQRDTDAICKEHAGGDEESAPQVEKSVFWGPKKPLHNQWEMKVDNLDIRNPAWSKFVQRAAVKAAGDLGIKSDAGAVKANFVKARVWASGACLPPYKDIPNVVGCFGKLLICLPAAHQGGSLLVTYEGETKKFLTETSSFWGYSYFAWYADVTIEFTPLVSGYRFMLEYDFILPPPAKRPSLAYVYSEKGKLRDLLAAWNDDVKKDEATKKKFNFPTLLTYMCAGHYTSQPLSIKILQGSDRLRATCLKDICSQIDMCVYIADLDRTCSGFSDCHYGDVEDHHDIHTVDEDEITLSDFVDLNGNAVAGSISVQEDEHFIQSEPFDDIPDDEDFDYYHGHVTHYYRRTVLVMIPSVAKGEWFPQESGETRPNKRKRTVEVIDLE